MLRLTQDADTYRTQTTRSYYQVLDISPGEQDPQVIEEAALRWSRHFRAYQLTRASECTLRLNEIARALSTLLDPVRRREYDLSLVKPLCPAPSERQRPCERVTPVLAQGKSALRADEKRESILARRRETCDVKLVYRRRAR
jgi:hypothetical protein